MDRTIDNDVYNTVMENIAMSKDWFAELVFNGTITIGDIALGELQTSI